MTALSPAQRTALAAIRADLDKVSRYDDESIVHAKWVRQRYECGCYPSYAPARQAAVRTAWHEAGHAVAAIALGARFSSASIHHGHRSEGRVHAVAGGADRGFVIDAAGHQAEQLMQWTVPESDDDLRAWLSSWRTDGDARRFRRGCAQHFDGDEMAAWRYSQQLLAPLRPQIRLLARGLLVYPRHLPYNVAVSLT